jgi:DNA repair exonuclease SbcCD ATPase subunit
MKTEKKKPVKEEAFGATGALNQVFAVQKPYSGCQLTSLVKPIDPLLGVGAGHEIAPEKVHAVYPTKDLADKAADALFLEFQKSEKALEEKKHMTAEKIKKTMDELEKKRKTHVDMIKENPKDSQKHRGKVAELAHQIDELVNTLEKIEKSKKNLDEKNKGDKKELKEALKKVFAKKKIKEALTKKDKLSSAEYQKEKKKADFKASDWKWNKEEDLYNKK